MDSGVRKRFMSPFSFTKVMDQSSLNASPSSWQQGQCSTQPSTPKLQFGTQSLKAKSIMSPCRSEEKSLKPLKQISESSLERGLRQKVSRSLFSIKPREVEELAPLEQRPLSKQQSYLEKQQMCKMDSIARSNLPRLDRERTSISLVELAVPEILTEANSVDIANDYLPLEAVLGAHDEVEVKHPSDFCELLKPEAVEKFKIAICPTKICLPTFPNLSHLSTKSIIDDVVLKDIGSQATRLPKEKEKFVEVQSLGEPKSFELPSAKKRNMEGYIGLRESKEYSLQEPSLGISLISDVSRSQKKWIRGFSIPRCGRLTNQSYQAQSKEFEDILSSKVRKVAEVADCLHHKELLYQILQF